MHTWRSRQLPILTLKCTTRQWGDWRSNHTIYFRHLHNTPKTTLKTSASRLKLNVQPRTEPVKSKQLTLHSQTHAPQASSPLTMGACSLRSRSPYRSGRPASAAGTPRKDTTRHDETGQDRTRHDKTGQDTTRQDKAGQDRKKQGKTGLDKTGQDSTRQDKTIQDRTGQDRRRQDRTRQDKKGQDKIRLDKTGLDKRGQDRTRHT